ncbi:hypothetical protein BTVI_87556 [Pitangus sulphuratus]|nr:hypothetical protein BTVI_87556 [Pitangus sulphuratus]
MGSEETKGNADDLKGYGKLETPGSAEDLLQRDLLHQAEEIVELMKENQKNCTLENLEKLKAVLDFLYKKVPKTFINLVDSTELATAPPACQGYSNASNPDRNQCSCVGERFTLDDNILRWSYQDAWEKLLESERFDQRDDFTVVLQPSLQERNLLLRQDKDGLTATSKTQMKTLEDYIFMAVGLWNNMMQPVGQKQPYGVTKIAEVQCPSQERSYGTNIPCTDRDPSDTVPVSVHDLKPADIRVIAAVGDSITAANGAGSKPHDVLNVLVQYRGLSWSVGGNENISTVTTLPNILREFNPTLVGYSTGTGSENSENAALNQAVTGARAEDVPQQVRKLVDRMKNNTGINFQTDWKLITLFIGGNDLCTFCEDPFVSLGREERKRRADLSTVLLSHRILCPCVITPKDNSDELKKLIYFNRRYQLEPLGEKTDNQSIEEEILLKCPNAAVPFLRTYKNSNYTYPNQTPAGTGIASDGLEDLATQYRGLSWSIGGDESLKNVTTLPNIFREFNVTITGYSTGTGSENDSNAFLNQAVPGAEAEHLPAQARNLVRLMKSDYRIDFSADWKLITVFIGNNDLCNYCKDPVPKALVNLVDVADVHPLRQFFVDTQVQCPTYLADYLCSCIFTGEENSENLTMVREATRAYRLGIQRLIESGRYDTHENFTVVIQPFLQNIKIPLGQDGQPDVSYFSPDCFHPSQKGHSQLAKALWNAMLQPVGQKADSFDFTDDIVLGCPAQNKPFLGTYKNSNYTPVEPTREPIEGQELDSMILVVPFQPGIFCDSVTLWSEEGLVILFLSHCTFKYSIHELRPADIRVVGALGDSLTTAVGAKVPDLETDWRGLSWSIGGDETLEIQATLPNILKKFNPNLFGFSTGISKETAGFNVAERNAMARNMPAQARELVELMRNSSETNSVQKYVKHLQDTLDIFYEEAEALQLINSGRYENREDFAVVMQPFFRNTLLPLDSTGWPDLSFFAADCFHFSVRGYAEMAMALWNNMLEPVGEKQTYNNFTLDRSKLKCPNPEKPFLFTRRNSGFGNSDLNLEKSEPSVPYWAVIVAAIAGVLLGSLVVCAVSRRRTKKSQRSSPIDQMENLTLPYGYMKQSNLYIKRDGPALPLNDWGIHVTQIHNRVPGPVDIRLFIQSVSAPNGDTKRAGMDEAVQKKIHSSLSILELTNSAEEHCEGHLETALGTRRGKVTHGIFNAYEAETM